MDNLQLEMILNQMNIGQLEEVIKYTNKLLKEKQKKNPTFNLCLKIWFKFYQDQKGLEFVMSPQEGKSLKGLIKKIEQSMKNENIEINAPNTMQIFAHFLQGVDGWILDHLSLTLLNSKYNEIQARLVKEVKSEQESKSYFDNYGE